MSGALVTGGAGFVGSHLVDRLLAAGHGVRVLDDLSTGRRDNVDPAAEIVHGDVRSPRDVERAVSGVEVVYHLAARTSVQRSLADPAGTAAVNAGGTAEVLRAAARAGVRRVVLVSSSSVYGPAPRRPTPEDEPLRPRSPYAASKARAERLAAAADVEAVVVRPFNVFGPRQRHDSAYAAVVARWLRCALTGEPAPLYGDGRQTRDFTYVGDLVDALHAAAGAPAGTTANVSGGRPASLLDLALHVEAVCGAPLRLTRLPARPADAHDSEADLTLAGRLLGYTPAVGLREGLALTLAAEPLARVA